MWWAVAAIQGSAPRAPSYFGPSLFFCFIAHENYDPSIFPCP